MSLTECTDCGREVLVRASACPGCGAPLRAQTIEQTGKKYKAWQMVGFALVAGGVVAQLAGAPGVIILLLYGAGIIAAAGAGLGAWWRHA